jgi:hypothetical protein
VKPPGAVWYLPWRYARWRGVNGPENIDGGIFD